MILTFGSISVGALSVVFCQDWGSYTGWLPIGVSRDMGVDEIGLPETTLWSALVSVCWDWGGGPWTTLWSALGLQSGCKLVLVLALHYGPPWVFSLVVSLSGPCTALWSALDLQSGCKFVLVLDTLWLALGLQSACKLDHIVADLGSQVCDIIRPWVQMLFGPRPICDLALVPNAIWPWDHMCFGPGTIWYFIRP